MVVLLGWSYFYTPRKAPTDEANTNTNTAVNANSTTAPAQLPAAQVPQPQQQQQQVASTLDTVPNRTITVRSPLYEVKLDSRGALATSWIILRDKSPNEDRPVYGDGSTDANKKPLQLISDEALKRSPRQIPFRLATDDANLNSLVNDRNYQVSEPGDTIELADGQQ
jgi:YidC/Oxa1 family membrane protein insertase